MVSHLQYGKSKLSYESRPWQQSVTYRYREFFIFLVVSEPVSEKSLGTGIVKIWYRKKVPEPVSEKFGTGADFLSPIFF